MEDHRKTKAQLLDELLRLRRREALLAAELAELKRAETLIKAKRDVATALTETEREEKYHAIFDNVAIGINLTGPDGRYLETNSAWANMLGFSEDELEGLTFLDITHPEDRQKSREKYSALMRGDIASYRLEKRYVRKDGVTLWVDVSVSAIRNSHSEHVATIGVVQDITARKLAEEALDLERRKFQTLVEQGPFGIILVNTDWSFEYVNPKFKELFGYSLEETPGGREWFRQAYPDSEYRRQAISTWIEDLKTAEVGVARPRNFTVRCKDGSEKMVSFRAVQLQTGHDLVICEDISERLRSEEALRQSEKLLGNILSASPIGIAYSEGGRIKWANHAMSELFGHAQEDEWLGREPTEFFASPEEYHFVQDTFFKSLMQGGPAEAESRFRRDDGSVFYGYLTATALDSSSPWKGAVTTITDISARKRAEETRLRLETAIEQAAETILITDENGRILYVNPAFQRTTGYSCQEVLGQNPRLLKSDKHSWEFYRDMWETLTRGEVWDGHFINRRKDGRLYEEEATISPIKDATGRTINYVAVKRDVTREVMLEKQLQHAQKMEAVGTLAGGFAHDFNNLLQVVGGYTDLLLLGRGPSDPDYAKLLGVKKSVRNGADLVKRILTFSRKVETSPRPVDLNHELRQALELLLRTISKMIEIDLVLAEDLRPIHADPGQLEQIIFNLALNAKDAMPDGGKLVFETRNIRLDEAYCRAHFDARPGDHVLFSVSDTGHGMGRDVVDRIFEPFFTTKEPGEGTGLGLSMVFGIVKTHGGHISCYSEPAVGTTFKLYFPAIDIETPAEADKTTELPAGGHETVLLVDDEEIIRSLGKEMLTLAGYDVLTAATGQEALMIYGERKDEISLVILDLVMPEMSGLKCLEELLKIDSRAKVLIASGYSAKGPAEGALKSGARSFVSKPYNIKELLESVRGVLDSDDKQA